MYYKNYVHTWLNDGIFRVHRFSIATSARLRKSECVFRFYVYGGIFDNPPGHFFLSAYGTVFGALCAYGFFGFVLGLPVRSLPLFRAP
jgi:hypothetical protein